MPQLDHSQTVCRIRWRKGEPLGLCKSPKPTFFDLPREVRDQVYDAALGGPGREIKVGKIQDHEDTASSSTHRSSSESEGGLSEALFANTPQFRFLLYRSFRQDVNVGLLSCHRLIYGEASVRLFKYNTFRFDCRSNWAELCKFLIRINPYHCHNLRSIVVEISEPGTAYQSSSGVRELQSIDQESSYTPGPWLGTEQRASEGYVDDVSDPNLKACFQILRGEGLPLTLTLCLWPEVSTGTPLGFKWRLALPKRVEKLRRKAASCGTNARQVQIVWRIAVIAARYAERKDTMASMGWRLTGMTPLTDAERRIRGAPGGDPPADYWATFAFGEHLPDVRA